MKNDSKEKIGLLGIWLSLYALGCGGGGTLGLTGGQLNKYKAFLNKAFAGKPTGHGKLVQKRANIKKNQPKPRTSVGAGTIYFDDLSQLWVRVDVYITDTDEFGSVTLKQWDYALFQDQALTQPAGRNYYTIYVANGKNVIEDGSDYLAGTLTGDHSYEKLISDPTTPDTDYYFEIHDHVSDYLTKSHTIWTDSTGVQTNTSDIFYNSGTHLTYSGTWNRNGNVSMMYSDNSGSTSTVNWYPDGSGGFTLTNPADPVLPATGTWTDAGTGTATFANGSSVPFNLTDTGLTF